ncbi:MAG TPA: methyltransferase domain-containing protein [Candidatus Nanoarchaeia archaeon]|nr:methyltransferase domain-containing protein [Candidatus Nanoarchaeia archaeon]
MNKEQMLKSIELYNSQFGEIDDKILKAIGKIDRKNFMPEDVQKNAYEDTAIPIGHNQTISQPSTVARMLSLLDIKPKDKILEIGTGSAWNAALLATLAKNGKLTTLEIVPELAKKAENKIKKLNIKNIEVKTEDFRKIKNKFDKIIFTAGIQKDQKQIVENTAKKNLKENGILICPYKYGPLIIIKKQKGRLIKEYTKEEYVFVPLVI